MVQEQVREILDTAPMPVTDGAVGRKICLISYETVGAHLLRRQLVGSLAVDEQQNGLVDSPPSLPHRVRVQAPVYQRRKVVGRQDAETPPACVKPFPILRRCDWHHLAEQCTQR